MKVFKVQIDVTIDAEDIDDAMRRLGTYYLSLVEDPDTPRIFRSGQARIAPLEVK